MTDPDRFAIIPIYSDSTGNGAIPQNAVAHGSWSTITGRLRDSRQQRQMLALINDAAHAKETLADIRAREDSVAEREDAVAAYEDNLKQTLLHELVGKVDALTSRMDSLEASRAHDPEDDILPPPPGSPSPSTGDEGNLEAPIAPPETHDLEYEDQK